MLCTTVPESMLMDCSDLSFDTVYSVLPSGEKLRARHVFLWWVKVMRSRLSSVVE